MIIIVFITLYILSQFILLLLLPSDDQETYERKGNAGEARVSTILLKQQDRDFRVFNDVLIRTKRGSTQIDHIVVSTYGIFVIETKNFSGWIHGNEKAEYWTQTFYQTRNKFRNPIRQNWAHIYALKEVLSDYRYIAYYPVIVFTGDGELKNINSTVPVVYDYQLLDTIKDLRGVQILSEEQVACIADRLDSVNIQDREAVKEHVYAVQKQVYERKQKEKSLICPRCGWSLVIRNGQYGKFYGCSHYPKCRYTQNLRD